MVIEDNHLLDAKDKSLLGKYANRIVKEIKLAHPLDRFASMFVDAMIVFFAVSIPIAPFQKKMSEAQMISDYNQLSAAFAIIVVIVGLVAIFYQTLMTWRFGGTVGKLLFKLRVVDIWSLEKPRLMESFIRATAHWFETLCLAIPHFAIHSDSKRRPLHDRAANTIVVTTGERTSKSPDHAESILIRTFFIAVYAFAFSFMMFVAKGAISLIQSDENADLYSLLEMNHCKEVSRAQSHWPLERGQLPTRISIALGLFAAGEVDEQCLDTEAYLEFQVGNQKELAYLARAFATADDSEVSNRYLDRVCKEKEDSEACALSDLISLWTESRWEEATVGFQARLVDASVFVKAWAIKHFEKIHDYSQELKIVDGLWPLPSINQFLATHRTVALWGVDRKEESIVSMKGAIELLPSSKQMGLASWICYQQIESSCEAKNLPESCTHFEAHLETEKPLFDYDLFAVTFARVSECKGEWNLSEFTKDIESDSLRQYGEIVEKIRTAKSEDEVLEVNQALYEYLQMTDENSVVAHDLRLRALRAGNSYQNINEETLALWESAKPGSIWNKSSLGKALAKNNKTASQSDRLPASTHRTKK